MINRFRLIGNILEHLDHPRFRAAYTPREDGSYEALGDAIEWLDAPPTDVRTVAKLMRESGDYFAAHLRRDWLQDEAIARAKELGITAYGLAKATGWAVSENHIRRYLARERSMGSHKLQHLLRVLGLTVVAE
jgi:predicted DNA-binding transcriptional regulator YafY